jgi:hypothetical protein
MRAKFGASPNAQLDARPSLFAEGRLHSRLDRASEARSDLYIDSGADIRSHHAIVGHLAIEEVA